MTQRSIDVTPRTEDALAIRDAIYRLEDQLPVEVTDEVIEKAAWWGATVLAGNDTLNLTRITDADEMALKHFVDSWSVMGVLRDIPAGATLLDIGTGAGFPGVPIAIARPDITTIFIDTMGKRLNWIKAAYAALGWDAPKTVHARAEVIGCDEKWREQADVVLARAVSAMPTLLEWCGPLVKRGGLFVAMKGPDVEPYGSAARQLGLTHEKTITGTLYGIEEIERNIVCFRKTAKTPVNLPRAINEIKRKPLG